MRFQTKLQDSPRTPRKLRSNLNESEILADLIYNSVTSLHRGRKNHDRSAHLVVPSLALA